MISQAGDLARRLARDAEAVCRHYLSRGCRRGRYWIVGDVSNNPGRSLYVRLEGAESGPGAAGKWTDAATGEHGDLLDLIGLNRELPSLRERIAEAQAFLALPHPPAAPVRRACAPSSSGAAARRLFASGRPVPGSLAEAYLRARRITAPLDWPALRFHPRVWYRENADAPLQSWPALLAAVTDLNGEITGIQRSWLDPRSAAKAPVHDPRRALGQLLGNGVRFGIASDLVAVGEGLETMLSLLSVLPDLPMIAGLSASHLAALGFGLSWRRVYVAHDNDLAGITAAARLRERCNAHAIDIRDLVPLHADFNIDLRRLGSRDMLARLAPQLVADDVNRLLPPIR